jgi:hypothetical protein
MTLDEVKAQGAKTLGTLSYIPKEGWEELPMDRLRQMKAELSSELTAARSSEERKMILTRDRNLSNALEKAEHGGRIFGVIWNDKRRIGPLTVPGYEYLFASTKYRG